MLEWHPPRLARRLATKAVNKAPTFFYRGGNGHGTKQDLTELQDGPLLLGCPVGS